jgi:hypothetical protein
MAGVIGAVISFAVAAASLAGEPGRAVGGSAQSRAASKPTTWLVVIAADQYQHVRPLRYCRDDGLRLVKTLKQRGQRDSVRVLELLEGPDAKLIPTRDNILVAVPEFLRQVGRRDTVIVFFSGHGFLEPNVGAFLAPIDCDPKRLGLSAVRVAELRRYLESCKAASKVLMLDACHAGNVKGAEEGLTAKDLEADLGETSEVYTLASCQGKQQSFIWDEKKQGLFTYWLNRGLEGAADGNGDGTITAGELFDFVRLMVPLTSNSRFRQEQTPARIAGPTLPETLELLRLRPEAVSTALNRLAELTHEQVLARGVQKVGVLEFTNQLGRAESLGGEVGMFGRAAAEKVEEYLVQHHGDAYAVADRRQLNRATKDVTVEDLGDPAVLRRLPNAVPKLEAVLVGSFLRIGSGRRLRLNCKLLGLPEGNVLASISIAIDIDEDFWSLAGHSADFRPALVPSPDSPTAAQCLNQPHPLLSEAFPYRVAIRVGGAERKLQPGKDGKLYVGLRAGEEYEVFIHNKSDEPTKVQVFVDGLNVLGAVRQLPDEARPWDFPAHAKLAIGRWHREVASSQPGKQEFEGGKFVVVEPAASLAGRQRFGEDIGQITVLFYEAVPPSVARGSRSLLGTGESDDKQRIVYGRANELVAGRPVASVTIYYVAADTLNQNR